ncbi:DNA polymerase-3 subunit epsilon [Sulfuritortus calidifontis]|uniref:DNA polymerase-3 subunit epsilon n=1 Tax=Sulfuritortus calidifontis TaxID=1914471 RepID=A0A4R3JVN2_9PROT|nr:3'-5' exonuclease [Sulfuritortus calidifontis]TCS72143.1 DNA polymerase-3 subunit epsilon [Sulfuritortus calidifontis]
MSLPLWHWLARRLDRVALPPDLAGRLAAWQALPPADLSLPLAQGRYVVVDVESTGLDMRRDRLIAIGAVAVVDGRIRLADSFEIVLRQVQVSAKNNILIHGIGGERQREGVEPAEALLRFLEYLGASPLVAFHVAFDETMIRRACRQYLGIRFRRPWLDLAYVMPGLLPNTNRKHRALDHWTGRFSIGNYARHNALADALATAQLLLAALPLARTQGFDHFQALQDLEKAQHWLERNT